MKLESYELWKITEKIEYQVMQHSEIITTSRNNNTISKQALNWNPQGD